MLPKTKRLTRHECNDLLQAKTTVVHTSSFFARYILAEEFKLAVAVSKKVSKFAVERNKIRRIVNDGFQDSLDISVHILVSVKKGSREKKPKELVEEVKGLAERIKRQVS